MEIPAWAEALFERAVTVFEAPASDTLQAAGSTDLLPWIDTLLTELPLLAEQLKAGIFPASFLANLLGAGPGLIAVLPGLLAIYAVLYLLSCGWTVALRLKTAQSSLLSFSRQCTNALLTWAGFLLYPMWKVARQSGGAYSLLVLGAFLLAVAIPVSSVIRYLWYYRLNGIPHAIADVGFGLFALAALLLSAMTGPLIFLLPVAAIAMLTVIQREGHAPEESEEPEAKPAPIGENTAQDPAPSPEADQEVPLQDPVSRP